LIKRLERITHGNGAGRLLVQHYVEEASWYSFTEFEQEVFRRMIRRFPRELAAVVF
jgi:hypothetical protein